MTDHIAAAKAGRMDANLRNQVLCQLEHADNLQRVYAFVIQGRYASACFLLLQLFRKAAQDQHELDAIKAQEVLEAFEAAAQERRLAAEQQ